MSTVEELRDSAYTLERGNWPLAAERMRKAAAELDTLKTEVELLRLQVQSWKAEYDTLKHEVERLREQLTALREYVREQTAIAVPAHEAGGINQVNFRLGMIKAYHDIEKRLGTSDRVSMEKPVDIHDQELFAEIRKQKREEKQGDL